MNVSVSTVYAAMIGCLLTLGSIAVSPNLSLPNTAFIPQKPAGDFGPWQYVGDQTLDDRERSLLAVKDYWRVVYEHRDSGLVATVTWMSGDRGPMVSHHPSICYRHESMSSSGPSVRWGMISTSDQFRLQTFRSRGLIDTSTTVAHAWKDTDAWDAPQYPRLAFVDTASLERLQVSIRHPSAMDRQVRQQIRQLTMGLATLALPNDSYPTTRTWASHETR